MATTYLKWIGAALFLAIATPALAECRCECVDGKSEAICANSYDFKPVCGNFCPMAPTSIKPIDIPTTPPIGMKSCENKQVMNQQTRRYEWRQVCE